MIGTGFDVRVKIQDIVASQLPEFILSDSPLTDDFLRQFYISQEFQGGAIDLASNLDQYLNLKDLTETSKAEIILTGDIDETSGVIPVNTTKGFPNEWGLLKVGDEIITYTGITTNTFTGAVRGFSGITAFSQPNDPSNLVFETSSASSHASGDSVQNLSILFLEEFYNKIKFTFAPGFESIETSSDVNAATWIQNVRSFFQSKGSEESIKILFKVLYGEDPTVIDLEEYLIKPSFAEYNRSDYAIGIPIEGNPIDLLGKTVKQSNANVFGSITQIEPFIRNQRVYYKIFYFVNTEELSSERKTFTVPGRSKAHRGWDASQKTLTVDSTIGFNGNNSFVSTDGTKFQYEEKTVNQFLGVTCEDPEKVVLTGDELNEEIYIVGQNDSGEDVVLLLTGVVSDVEFEVEPFLLQTGEEIFVESLGENIQSERVTRNDQTFKEIVANSFVYNTSVRFDVIDISGTVFTINNSYLDKAFINVGDTVDILASGTNTVYASNRLVTEVSYENATITVEDLTGLPDGANVDLRRNQRYAVSGSAAIDYGNNAVLANTLNVYDATDFDGTLFVATNSLPAYEIDISLTENIITDIQPDNLDNFNNLEGTYEIVRVPQDVEFLTGERIVYSVEGGADPICDPGSYIVEVLSSRSFRLYASPSFIGTPSFIPLTLTTAPGQHIFTLESQEDRTINSLKKYVKIPLPQDKSNISPQRTPQEIEDEETIAILTNGVEIKTPRGRDKVYFGPLTGVDVISGGNDYSVITPPTLTFSDSTVATKGSTAEATAAMKGKLEKILIDPQDFDINRVFSITVTGGNSRGATAEAQIEQRSRSIVFDAREFIFGGGIDPVNETITFPVDHNIQQAEPLTYNNKGNPSIAIGPYGGSNGVNGSTLANGGVYYPNILNSRTIEIYNTLEDLTAGINTIGFTKDEQVFGAQEFSTQLKPQIVAATIIDDGGFFYNRTITLFGRDNVSFPYSEFIYPSHGFETGEKVVYTGSGNVVQPLTRGDTYLILKVDEDKFRLCELGPDGDELFNLNRLDFVVFQTRGGSSATHVFSYPEIKAEVVVSSSSVPNPQVVATPFIRGGIERVYLLDNGFYGSDIINFQKSPNIDTSFGFGAKIVPIINGGLVGSVQILSKGRNYTDTPEIKVVDPTGSGQGAVLRAEVVDGEIVDIVIISSGFSYSDLSVIDVVDFDRRAILQANIRPLTVNNVVKSGFESLSGNQYSILSYDRLIRESVYNDLGLEHSPIIGWAKDGNPIYGPFGYDEFDNSNSQIRAMVTSYVRDTSNIDGRPDELKYPAGFFIEDYEYDGSGDLDRYNGRYCKTPEFPNGIYAYFATVDPSSSSTQRPPEFPYFIGDSFRDSPKTELDEISQDFDISDHPIYRNTFPYAVGNPFIGSEFLDQSYLTDTQSTVVTDLNRGTVSSITIVGAGKSYAVGDVARFDASEDNLSVQVSKIDGVFVKSVGLDILSYNRDITRVVRSTPDRVRVYVEGNHEYLDGDNVTISGLSAELEVLSGSNKIRVASDSMSLFAPVPSTSFDSIFDIFVNSISENVSVGSSIIVNNEVGGNEYLEILNIFPVNKALRVKRTTGYGVTHSIGTIISTVPNYFEIDNSSVDFTSEVDEKYYFNPIQSMGFGAEPGIGITATYSIGNIDDTISLQSQTIFLPNNTFKKNEKVIFSKTAFGEDIRCVDVNGTNFIVPSIVNELFIHKTSQNTIGLKTSKTAEPLLFLPPINPSAVNSPEYLIESQRSYEDCNLDRYSSVVETQEDHLLQNGDIVDLEVISKRTRGNLNNNEVAVSFNEDRQYLLIDPRDTDAVVFEDNLITVTDHGYSNGDVLFYTTEATPIGGLVSGAAYYVIVFDADRFFLADTLQDTTAGNELPVVLTSNGSGVQSLFKINPQIRVTANNNLVFDVSDASLDGYELKLFSDPSLTEVLENNGKDSDFIVRYSADGNKVFVDYSDNSQRTFFYGLTKDGILIQPNIGVPSYSTVTYVDSAYTSSGVITKIDEKTYRFPLSVKPSATQYNIEDNDCELSYSTRSRNTLGAISEVEIVSAGQNFSKLPEFISMVSDTGTNAELRANTNDIGTIAAYRIQNPGWGYYGDSSLRPKGQIQPKVAFTDSDFITDITVLDGGRGYQTPPTAVLVDSVTRQATNSGSLSINIQSSVIVEVEINLSPTGLSKNTHELFVADGDNGIPILSVVSFDENTGKATFEMQTPIAGYGAVPFAVGDSVFVENVISSNGETTYLNSSEIGYLFPKVTQVDPSNPILVTVEYPEQYWELIGNFEEDQNSFSSIINKKNYPQFSVLQATAILVVGERLSYINEQGVIQDTDLVVEESSEAFLKVKGSYDIRVGDVFKGNVSGIVVTVLQYDKTACTFKIDSISRFSNGWNNKVGFTNEETQSLPDNDYYQNLSYSIKSTVEYSDLIGPVNKLVHPSGLKNFADTKIESSANVSVTGITTDNITIDLIGLTDVAGTPLRVDRINTFDLGYDDEVLGNKSAAIRFNALTDNKRLTDYFALFTNRVLLMDDISGDFIDADNSADIVRYVDFDIADAPMVRVVGQIRNPFTDEIQLVESVILYEGNNTVTLQKAVVSSFNDLGFGEIAGEANGTGGLPTVRYTPYEEFVDSTDVDLKILSAQYLTEQAPEFEDIGYVRLISRQGVVQPGETVNIYSSRTNARALAAYVQTKDNVPATTNLRYTEVYTFNGGGGDTYYAEYTFDSELTTGYSDSNSDLSFTSVALSNNRVGLELTNNGTTAKRYDIKLTEFTTSPSGSTVYRFKRGSIPVGTEKSINLISTFENTTSTTPDITLLALNRDEFQTARCMVNVRGVQLNAIYQVMLANSNGDGYATSYPFIEEGTQGIGIGTFGAVINGSDMELHFYPEAGVPAESLQIITYAEAFIRENDYRNYVDEPLDYGVVTENYYIAPYNAPFGSRRDRVRFPLTYEGTPIYEKEFEPQSTVNGTLFTIPDHFFSDAEELYYIPGDSVDGPSSPMVIDQVTDYLGNQVTLMPSKVWAVKFSLKTFALAPTFNDAKARTNLINVVAFGAGNAHRIGMTLKSEKTIITIDGIVQSPIANTNLSYTIDEALDAEESFFTLTGIGTIRSGDLLKVEDEIVTIVDVGFSTTNNGPISNTGNIPLVEVTRGAVGTISTSHPNQTTASLLKGSYNIVESDIVFTEAPSGKGNLNINESNMVDLNATFQGRTFLQKEYDQIKIYDDISNKFDGISNKYEITYNGQAVDEIENGSGILLINDVYQTPTTDNNEGNNYFYEYDAVSGINTVVFTGITSANGNRVESRFDVNQNQIPRGGLIVSVGSTPGLGYAPLVGSIIEPNMSGDSIASVNSTEGPGSTVPVTYARYNNISGEMIVSLRSVPTTAQLSITDANYTNTSGLLVVTIADSLSANSIAEGDIIGLRSLFFECTSGGPVSQQAFPDEDPLFVVDTILTDNTFTVFVGASDIEHTYVSGGTVQRFDPFIFDKEGLDPQFVYLQNLTFSCPSGTPNNGVTLFPDTTDHLPVIRRLDAAHLLVYVGASDFPHTYVSGGTVGAYNKLSSGSGYRETVNVLVVEEGHTGTPAVIEGIPGDGGSLSFNVINGGTGYTNPNLYVPDPDYANLPVTAVFRRDGTLETGKNLFVTVNVGAAKTTAIGRSEYFEVSSFEITNQGYGFQEGDIVEVPGLVPGPGLVAPIEPFQITITKTFNDNFTAYNFGELDYIDSIKKLQNGRRRRFPLEYNGELLSFEIDPENEDSASIDPESVLLIFVNTVLQVPGESYFFEGGTTFQFLIPPRAEDDVDIYFYRGKRGVDSDQVDIPGEKIKPGDEVQIRKNNAIDDSKTQNLRTITEIIESDTARTTIYVGNGDLDTDKPRPVAWDKQKRDVFIYGEPVSKSRDSLESIIKPTSYAIKSFDPGHTEILLSDANLFKYETRFGTVIPSIDGRIYSQFAGVPVELQVVMSGDRVNSVNVLNPTTNFGYSAGDKISFNASPTGARATANLLISGGRINGVSIVDGGSGYTTAPSYVVSNPSQPYEDISTIATVQGWSAIITRITSGTTGPFNKSIEFEFDTTDPLVFSSDLQPGYRIALNGTSVGQGVQSYGDTASELVAVGANFLNCVYEVASISPTANGGTIVCNVSGSTDLSGINSVGDNLGAFSWGRLSNFTREGVQRSFIINPTAYDDEFTNYPVFRRTSEGLRNRGGLGKES